MKVLSLFDGISCGLVALKELGIKVDEYHAFEIEENAIKISQKNHPEIIRHGSVIDFNFSSLGQFDLLLGGSPCQDLSITKSKNRQGLEGSKSSLFWSFKEALDQTNPKYFLFENVASMKQKDKDIISQALGVQPIALNAVQFLPQNRERYYWTNIPIQPYQAPTEVKFRTLMEKSVPEKYYYKKPFSLEEDRTKNVIGLLDLNTYEANKRIYNPDGVIGCLTCVSGGYQEKKVYDEEQNRVRKLTPIEYERLQGLPENYTEGLSNNKRYSVCGNGWCVPVIVHILEGMNLDV